MHTLTHKSSFSHCSSHLVSFKVLRSMFLGTQQSCCSKWQQEGFSVDFPKIHLKLIWIPFWPRKHSFFAIMVTDTYTWKYKVHSVSSLHLYYWRNTVFPTQIQDNDEPIERGWEIMRNTYCRVTDRWDWCLLLWNKSNRVQCKCGELKFAWAKCWCWSNINCVFKDYFLIDESRWWLIRPERQSALMSHTLRSHCKKQFVCVAQ